MVAGCCLTGVIYQLVAHCIGMDGSLSTITTTQPPSWSVIVAVGALAGLIAAIVMDWPMSRQPDGFTPAAIAAGIVTRQSVDDVSMAELLVVHHGAGLLAGVLYGGFVVGFSDGLPAVTTVGGLDIVAHLLAVSLVTGFIYGFFAHIVLPRADGRSYEEQSTAIRGQWLRSSLVFGATLVFAVPVLVSAIVG